MKSKEEIEEMMKYLEEQNLFTNPESVFNKSYIKGAFDALNWTRGRTWFLGKVLESLNTTEIEDEGVVVE